MSVALLIRIGITVSMCESTSLGGNSENIKLKVMHAFLET